MLATHWQRYWFSTDRADRPSPAAGAVDQTYPKPTTLAAWLACGRVAYSAMDVLFDLSSCIQDDRTTPGPPSSR